MNFISSLLCVLLQSSAFHSAVVTANVTRVEELLQSEIYVDCTSEVSYDIFKYQLCVILCLKSSDQTCKLNDCRCLQ